MQEPLIPARKGQSSETAVGEQKKSDLTRIVEYASIPEMLTQRDKWLYGIVAFLTTLSPVSYLRPAYEDEPFALPDDPAFKWNQVAATWIPTAFIFYMAALTFFAIRAARVVPKELRDIHGGQGDGNNWLFYVICFLSSLPLTTPLVAFPLLKTKEQEYEGLVNTVNAILIAIILAANTLAHLLPLEVISTHPVYGAPVELYRYGKKKWQERPLTPEEKSSRKAAADKAVAIGRRKQNLAQMLRAKKAQLLDSCFVPKNPKYKGLSGYEIRLNGDFQRVSDSEGESFATKLLAYGQTSFVSNPDSCRQKAYNFFLEAVGQIGAWWVVAESQGYLGNTGLTLSKMTGSPAAGWTLAAVPMWAFGVLMHKIGADNFRDNLDFMIGFVRGERSLSWQLKYFLNFYVGLGLLLVNLDLSYFTPGSANTMIRIDQENSWGQEATEDYISFTRWAFVILVACVLPAMEAYLSGRFAKYYGSPEVREIVEFDERVERVIALLLASKDDRFELMEARLSSSAVPVDTPSAPSVASSSSAADALSDPLLAPGPSTADASSTSSVSSGSSSINGQPSKQPSVSWCSWFPCCRSSAEQEELDIERAVLPTINS